MVARELRAARRAAAGRGANRRRVPRSRRRRARARRRASCPCRRSAARRAPLRKRRRWPRRPARATRSSARAASSAPSRREAALIPEMTRSTAMRLATSPALCPPMPSASTAKPAARVGGDAVFVLRPHPARIGRGRHVEDRAHRARGSRELRRRVRARSRARSERQQPAGPDVVAQVAAARVRRDEKSGLARGPCAGSLRRRGARCGRPGRDRRPRWHPVRAPFRAGTDVRAFILNIYRVNATGHSTVPPREAGVPFYSLGEAALALRLGPRRSANEGNLPRFPLRNAPSPAQSAEQDAGRKPVLPREVAAARPSCRRRRARAALRSPRPARSRGSSLR